MPNLNGGLDSARALISLVCITALLCTVAHIDTAYAISSSGGEVGGNQGGSGTDPTNPGGGSGGVGGGGGTTGQVCQPRGCSDEVVPNNILRNCMASSMTCYGRNQATTAAAIATCNTCKSGYERVTRTIKLSGECTNTVSYTDCKHPDAPDDCDGTCDDCTSTMWQTYNTGYQYRTVATCNTDLCECTKNRQEQCAQNYWGTPNVSMTSGCTRCAPDTARCMAGSTSITACYLPNGTVGSDSSGAWVIEGGNCFY